MTERFHHALQQASPALANALSPIVNAECFAGVITGQQFARLKQATNLTASELTLALLPFAACAAKPPMSNFKVGAIATGGSGNLYFGGNLEFLGQQLVQTVHAEQSAISHAWMKGETEITDITVNYTPCGHCRQFMNELTSAATLTIHLPNKPKASLHRYLPDAFGPKDLDITAPLLTPIDHGYQLAHSSAVEQAALQAFNRSYAPYSHNISGVAIELDDGSLFQGAYAENAAFNPSLAPLQIAINLLWLAGKDEAKIKTWCLIESAQGKFHHQQAAEQTMTSINAQCKLIYHVL